MLVERETKARKDILDVFKKLGLEDAAERERFQNLSDMDVLPTLKKRRDDYQRTRNNTMIERENTHA